MSLTAVIIASDEADRIGLAIGSVAFADEVLVLDSGSQDETVAVAESAGARVICTDWPGHVAQKNRGLAHARHDWVLSIDADEVVSPELAAEIVELLRCGPTQAGYRLRRLSWWAGQPIRHGLWFPDVRIRLVDRRRARWTGSDPHDRIELAGPAGDLRGLLEHHPFRSLSEHLATIDSYTATAAAGLLAGGRRVRLLDVVIRPFLHLMKALLLRAGFLDGVRGLMLAGLGASYVLLKWGRAWLVRSGVPRSWVGVKEAVDP